MSKRTRFRLLRRAAFLLPADTKRTRTHEVRPGMPWGQGRNVHPHHHARPHATPPRRTPEPTRAPHRAPLTTVSSMQQSHSCNTPSPPRYLPRARKAAGALPPTFRVFLISRFFHFASLARFANGGFLRQSGLGTSKHIRIIRNVGWPPAPDHVRSMTRETAIGPEIQLWQLLPLAPPLGYDRDR
jgi:hypothetical protein